jgi:DNA-binding IscR family transcriptional regulator
MRVTTWAEYGLIVSLHLAKQGNNGPTPARDMAKREGLPADYVEQILLKLRRAGLVSSVRGAKGGYYLKVSTVRCSGGNPCSIRPVWRELQRRVDDLLADISLEDLMLQESEVQALVSA